MQQVRVIGSIMLLLAISAHIIHARELKTISAANLNIPATDLVATVAQGKGEQGINSATTGHKLQGLFLLKGKLCFFGFWFCGRGKYGGKYGKYGGKYYGR